MLPSQIRTPKIYLIAALCAMAPDLDYLGFINKIPYGDLWGHRGITHSVFFAVALSFMIVVTFFKSQCHSKWLLMVLFFLSTLSHGIIDAFTNGGLGIAFYAPYSATRYFFPWQPIQVSPMGLAFFSERGLAVLISELYWIVLPCALLYAIQKALQKPNIADKS